MLDGAPVLSGIVSCWGINRRLGPCELVVLKASRTRNAGMMDGCSLLLDLDGAVAESV